MSKYAIIVDTIVSNIVLSDSSLQPNWILIDGLIPQPGIGWSYVNSTFYSPPVPQPALIYSISLKNFWRRFLISERETLQNILATGTQAQKNKLNAFRDYLNTGGNVELNDDYVITSVNLMEIAGVIGAGRATIILTP